MFVSTLFHYLPKLQHLLFSNGEEKEGEEEGLTTQAPSLLQVNFNLLFIMGGTVVIT